MKKYKEEKRKTKSKQISKARKPKLNLKLKLYNTLTRKKEIFRPIKKGKVGMYSCGPTVYSYQHIGNLRSYIFADILKRVLIYNGHNVKHVMNVTDVGHLTSDADTGEDKIEKAAKREKKTAREITEFYWNVFKEDFKKLNIIEPDVWCKASEHINEQIELIKKLEKKGFTYKTSDGIYFDTSKFKDYGKLARLKVKGLQAGKRVRVGEKRHATDFALWKFSKKPGMRQQEWESPWQIGFPGWHLECSAMSMRYLGKHFDIHTGGEDHIPVHHTNEIAQSEAATGKRFVNYWLHGAFLTFRGEKISKSSGGLYTISELEEKGYSSVVYRYFCLTAHYRSQLNFSLENLNNAKNALERLKRKIIEIKNNLEIRQVKSERILIYKKGFKEIINDDLNMPKALAFLWKMLENKELSNNEKYALILDFDKIFGLQLDKLDEEEIRAENDVQRMLEEREEARRKKDWEKADKIRKKIEERGYGIDDTLEGPKLRRVEKD